MHEHAAKGNRLTLYIGIGLFLGIVVGFLLNKNYVGEENNTIANAEARQAMLQQKMKVFEVTSDTAQFNKLTALKKQAEAEKKSAEIKMTESDENDGSGAMMVMWSDSLKDINKQLAALSDTNSLGFRSLAKQNDLFVAQKATATKSRDKKLEWFSLLADIFLRLIKMIVAPLVFTTLAVGVAKLGDIKAVGRIGGKTLLWFISASLVSLLLGLVLVNLFQPGHAMHLPLPDITASSGVDKAALSVKEFFYHMFPVSFVDAMAQNQILQIVVFSIFFGVAAAALGEKAAPIVKALDAAAHIILKITGYVMKLAPLAVFGAMAAIIAKQGIGILKTYSVFIGEFYFGLGLLWIVLIAAGAVFIGKRVLTLIKRVKEPALIAFSTASSEAAFPKTMLELERFGCKDKIVSFVLPLGYSFNLDGSMMYMTFASLFIAQSYGIHLDIGTQISMLLILMLTSKGIAGVPRASLVVIAGTLASFNIPEAGLALLLGIDPLLDMGRSATNVIGNSIATAVVSKMEGALTHEQDQGS